MAVPEGALKQVEEYCASRVSEDARDQIRVECSARGRAITIVERRPPWNPDFGSEWSEVKVAQLRYDEGRGAWSLCCSDSNGRWWEYDELGPTKEVGPLLNEIDADPTGIFWG
ncbi:MAG TPA: DUF3024 domain-containing protein [Thermoleophilaceae bacterium]